VTYCKLSILHHYVFGFSAFHWQGAIKRVGSHFTRAYGRLRDDIEPVSIVGSGVQCADKIEYCFSKGINTLIIGVADLDQRQLDMFGEKLLLKLKV